MNRLQGKTALLTGAGSGIGRAAAKTFAREGARLTLNDIDPEKLKEIEAELSTNGTEVVAIVGDVSDASDAQRMVETTVDHYGRMDVLVANAGIIPLVNVVNASPEDWDRVMAVDGRGMFLTCKYAIEAMLKTDGGSIVCVSSISGVAGQADQATYGPAKFVASGLAKHLAVEWAGSNIRVNAVAPGTIRTERVRELEGEPSGREYLDSIERLHPAGRLGEPGEVASAIVFLASPESSFVTGAILPVDGGYLAQ